MCGLYVSECVCVCVLVKIFSSEDGGGVLVPSPFQLKNLLRRQHCNDGGSSGTLSTKNSKWNNVEIFSLSKILLFLPIHLPCLLGHRLLSIFQFHCKLLLGLKLISLLIFKTHIALACLTPSLNVSLIFGPTKLG